jgi:hypothetical protein
VRLARSNHPVWSPPRAILRPLVLRVWLNRPASRCRTRRQRESPKSIQAQTAHRGLRLDDRHPTRLTGRARRALLGRQLLPARQFPGRNGPAYASVLAGYANPQQSGGPPKPSAKGSNTSQPAVSSGAASRRMSTDMFGTLDGMPAGTTLINTVGPPASDPTRRPSLFRECLILTASLPG